MALPRELTDKATHLGRAGQLAVMAELLARGWNVSIPEVDVGDDVFVAQDDGRELTRVQVKTASPVVVEGAVRVGSVDSVGGLAHAPESVRLPVPWPAPPAAP